MAEEVIVAQVAFARENVQVGPSSISLVRGDSLEFLKKNLDAVKATGLYFDVVMTSPPYNLGVDYEVYDDSIPRGEYLEWTKRWLELVRDNLSNDGSLFLNMGGKLKDPTVPEQVLAKALESGWVLQNKIYWIKSLTVRVKTKADHVREAAAKAGLEPAQVRDLVKAFAEIEGEGLERTFGHFKPIPKDRFLNDCVEMVYHLTRRGDVSLDRIAVGAPFEDKSNLTRGDRGKNGDRRCRGNALWIPYETIQNRDEDRPHPATFPVALAEYCFKLHGLSRIKKTLDPFSGIGHSAIAAARLGINHVGIEIGPKTHAEAVRRIKEEAAKASPKP